jgi:hypothetical protein
VTRFIAKLMVWLLASVALVYLCDWGIWRGRVASGGGMGKVTVGMLQVVQMKGNKEEWLPDGQQVVDCSKSLFPQAGAGACWWVEQHRTVFER